jgi:hypothetical protein
VDTGASRVAASSCAAVASLALLELDRFAGSAAALAALAGAARAAETVVDRLRVTGIVLSADVFFAETAGLASLTFVVSSSERLPVAIFPPVVFAIAICPCPGNQTAENLLL